MREGRVLVVDDQPNWREVLSSILTDEGLDVETAASLPEARRHLAAASFSVVIIDVRLVDDNPYDVQGVELIDYLHEYVQPPVPAVVMTGFSFEGLKEMLHTRYGDVHYLEKRELMEDVAPLCNLLDVIVPTSPQP